MQTQFGVSVYGLLIWTLISAPSAIPRAAAQDHAGEQPTRDAALERRRYEGLWPFYSRETFENGTVRNTAFFSAYRTQSSPNGDYSHRLFPFYSVWREQQGQHTGLALYPLLYFRDRTPDSYSDFALLLFARWGSATARHLLLWPLFHAATDPQTAFRWIPTLYRVAFEGEATRHRFGLPFVLDLFQHSKSTERTAWSIGAFFSWGQETRSGLPLMQHESHKKGAWHSHLFPLYFAGADKSGESKFDNYFQTPLVGVWRAGEQTRVVLPALLTWWRTEPDAYSVTALWPLARFAENSGGVHRRVLPFYYYDQSYERTSRFYPLFYGRVDDTATACTDHYVPLLLTRIRRCADRKATDVLFPFFHVSSGSEGTGFRLFPFFERFVSESREMFAVGSLLYRRYAFRDPQRVSHWALAGLVHWSRSENLARSWVLPIYLWRQALSDTYRSWRSMVLPLLYLRNDDRLHENDKWVVARRERFFWPVFGYRYNARFGFVESADPQPVSVKKERQGGRVAEVLDERRAYSVLSPFFETSATRTPAGQLIRREVHAPWPLVRYTAEEAQGVDSAGSRHFRIWPLVFTGVDEFRKYTRLYPLLSVETGSGAKRDFWTGTSIFQYREREKSTSFNVFPWLFSYERDESSRHVAGPLWLVYYSSRLAPAERWFHFLPVAFVEAREGFARGGMFPLFYNESSTDQPIRYSRAARFFFLWNRLRGADEWHHSLLWKAVSYTGNAGGDFDFRIFHRFLVTRSTQGQREFVLNPVVGYFSDAASGEQSFSILKYLYRYDVENGEATHRFLFIPVWSSRVGTDAQNGES